MVKSLLSEESEMEKANEFGSFAETIATLGELTKLESGVAAAIKNSKVPPKETRKFLKCMSVDEANNTALFQFLKELFNRIGLGHIRLVRNEIFRYDFAVENNTICKLFPHIKNKKTCYITAEAIMAFFTKDLGLPGTCEEISCMNAGDKKCEFALSLQPLAVYQLALDTHDREIISAIIDGSVVKNIATKLGMGDDEAQYRLSVLRKYHILDDSFSLTEIGETYYKYGEGMQAQEDDFPPPWKTMSDISSAISASTSFAEAFIETADEEPLWDVKEQDIVNLADEAKKSASFAELLSKQMKKGEK
jgi:predicted hydrocarbon binding protein